MKRLQISGSNLQMAVTGSTCLLNPNDSPWTSSLASFTSAVVGVRFIDTFQNPTTPGSPFASSRTLFTSAYVLYLAGIPYCHACWLVGGSCMGMAKRLTMWVGGWLQP